MRGRLIINLLSFFCVLIGLLIIVIRGPLVFAPRATLRFYRRLVSTKASVRGIGVFLAPVAAGLIAVSPDGGTAHAILHLFGWLWAAGTLWLLVAPGAYRSLAIEVLNFIEDSVDDAIVRILGLVAVMIGIALIHFGLNAA